MTDIKKLREMAEAATPGVGKACDYCSEYVEREGHVNFETADLFIGSDRPKEDAAYYATVNPATILSLLDRLEAAERDANRYRWLRPTAGTEKATYALEFSGALGVQKTLIMMSKQQ